MLQKTKTKWHWASATIFSYIALLSIYKKSLRRLHPGRGLFQIDEESLVQLVKEKDLLQLQTLGGVDGIALALRSGADQGISMDNDNEVTRRRECFGYNTYTKPLPKGYLYYFKECLQDLTIVILLVCSPISLVLGIILDGPKDGFINGTSMFISVSIIVALTSTFNYKRQKQLERIYQQEDSNNISIEVVRGRHRQQILVSEILVGDVVYLKNGDKVPADGLLIRGGSLAVDESSMTGESDHVEVNHAQNPFLISGTKVVDGGGGSVGCRMLVTCVGMNTSWGEMRSSGVPSEETKTTLQVRVRELTSSIGKVGLAVDFLVIAVMIVRYFTGNTKDDNGEPQFKGSRTKFTDILKFVMEIAQVAVTILVAALPEGLPMAMTLSFLHAMKRMKAEKVMVRRLSCCEIMGSATTICTDKTGTLTMNQMKVVKFWQGNECVEDKAAYSSKIAPSVMELFRQGIALNTSTTASVDRGTGTSSSTSTNAAIVEEYEFTGGNPTERAILSWAIQDLGMADIEQVRRNSTILHEEPFNSVTKRSGVLAKTSADDGTVLQQQQQQHVHWKGAPEVILAMCSSYYDSSGIVKELDENNQKMEFQQIIAGLAARSLRCIAFAHAKVDVNHVGGEDNSNGCDQLKQDGLSLLGLVGIRDPCHPAANKAVEDCQSAGVDVKMITGDNIYTAKAIATECGILNSDQDIVIEGQEFRSYSEEERMEKLDQICVVARSSPEDKQLMVQSLKQKAHVVAVAGDGTNDTLALKEADIGLAMGGRGTQDAIESADVLLLDDDFASVVTVLKWGRCVYNSIEKFVQFQLTANIAALVSSFVAIVSGGELPFTTVEMLWVNLIMDTLGALALASDKPTKELMQKPPVYGTEPFITNVMLRNILAQALYQIAVVLTLHFKGKLFMFGAEDPIGLVKDTFLFNTFVLCLVFNLFNSSNLEKKNVFDGILGNKLFMVIVATILVLHVVMVEFLNDVVGTQRLSWVQWSVCIGIAAMSLPIGWLVKCVPVPDKVNSFTRAINEGLELINQIKMY